MFLLSDLYIIFVYQDGWCKKREGSLQIHILTTAPNTCNKQQYIHYDHKFKIRSQTLDNIKDP